VDREGFSLYVNMHVSSISSSICNACEIREKRPLARQAYYQRSEAPALQQWSEVKKQPHYDILNVSTDMHAGSGTHPICM